MSASVEIYTWTICPFCIRAKALLDRKGVAYTEHVIDGEPGNVQASLREGIEHERIVGVGAVRDTYGAAHGAAGYQMEHEPAALGAARRDLLPCTSGPTRLHCLDFRARPTAGPTSTVEVSNA